MESQVKEHEEKVAQKEDYISFIENRFSDATAKAMVLEVQPKATNLKVQGSCGTSNEGRGSKGH